ncbi:MAG TPA: RNA pseudouridine synthase, partial [Polyangiaceae bacterium]
MAFEALFPAFRSQRILHDQGGLLLVDKPPGIVVHGGDEQHASDLVSRLKRVLRARGESDYLGVHQRLDLGTSGVLAFTRDPALNPAIAEQMEAHAVERAYVAIVAFSGKTRLRDSGVIEQRLETIKGRTRVVPSGGQRALTRYRVLASVAGRALLELRPETGRTHQLRVHLSHAGAPIVGDTSYGGVAAERLFLHARDLILQKPAVRGHAPVPAAFDDALYARAP